MSLLRSFSVFGMFDKPDFARLYHTSPLRGWLLPEKKKAPGYEFRSFFRAYFISFCFFVI